MSAVALVIALHAAGCLVIMALVRLAHQRDAATRRAREAGNREWQARMAADSLARELDAELERPAKRLSGVMQPWLSGDVKTYEFEETRLQLNLRGQVIMRDFPITLPLLCRAVDYMWRDGRDKIVADIASQLRKQRRLV